MNGSTPIFKMFIIFNIIIGWCFVWNKQSLLEDLERGEIKTDLRAEREHVAWSDQEKNNFYKSLRVFLGGLIYGILMNINDHMLYTIYYAVTILQICIQIYMMVFTLSLFFTIIQVTLIPHDSA